MAAHSSIPAWRIPWTETPGGLQSMGSQGIGHDQGTQHAATRSSFKRHFLKEFEVQLAYNVVLVSGVHQSDSVRSFIAVYSLSGVQLFHKSMDYSSPWRGSSVHGILQARILEWVAMSFSPGSSQPRDRTLISCTTERFFPTELLGLTICPLEVITKY